MSRDKRNTVFKILLAMFFLLLMVKYCTGCSKHLTKSQLRHAIKKADRADGIKR